jgi:hypothetical protein
VEGEGEGVGLNMALVDVAGQALLVRTLLLEQTAEETGERLGDIKRCSLRQEGSNPVRRLQL